MSIKPGWIALFLAFGTGSALAADQPGLASLPRYRLEVGQKLRFEGFTGERSNGKILGKRTELTVWVLDRAGEGRWRLLIEDRSRRVGMKWDKNAEGSLPAQVPTPRVEINLAPGQPPKPRPTWDHLWEDLEQSLREGTGANSPTLMTAYLHDDGRIDASPTALEIVNGQLAAYFPLLPRDLDAARLGWESGSTSNPTRCVPTKNLADPDVWEFTANRQTPLIPTATATTTTRYRFDRAQGLLVGSDGKGQAPTQLAFETIRRQALVGTERVDPAWITQVRAESPWVCALQDRLIALEDSTGDITAASTTAISSALADARREVHLPLLVEHLTELTAMADQFTAYQAKAATRRQALLGTPAPDWDLKDLDGTAQSLKAQRGKVIVLDFWYRGCPPCMDAMPKLKQVATHFQGRPVVLFGMNIDPSPADARFVADALQLNYPTLRTEGTDLAETYGAATFGFPTLVIIDRSGVIHAIHIGSGDDLAPSSIQTIQKLLDRQ